MMQELGFLESEVVYMINFDVVDKKKYPDFFVGMFYDLFINHAGRPVEVTLMLLGVIGFSFYISFETKEIVGYVFIVLITFIVLFRSIILYRSKFFFDGYRIFIRFGEWTYFEGNIKEVFLITRYTKAGGGYFKFLISRGGMLTGFSLYRDDLPEIFQNINIVEKERVDSIFKARRDI